MRLSEVLVVVSLVLGVGSASVVAVEYGELRRVASCGVEAAGCRFVVEGLNMIVSDTDVSATGKIVAKNPAVDGIVGIVASSGEAQVSAVGGKRYVPISQLAVRPGGQPFSPTFFKVVGLGASEAGSGVGHEAFQEGQSEALLGACVVLGLGSYQLLDSNGLVMAVVNALSDDAIQEGNCVVFSIDSIQSGSPTLSSSPTVSASVVPTSPGRTLLPTPIKGQTSSTPSNNPSAAASATPAPTTTESPLAPSSSSLIPSASPVSASPTPGNSPSPTPSGGTLVIPYDEAKAEQVELPCNCVELNRPLQVCGYFLKPVLSDFTGELCESASSPKCENVRYRCVEYNETSPLVCNVKSVYSFEEGGHAVVPKASGLPTCLRSSSNLTPCRLQKKTLISLSSGGVEVSPISELYETPISVTCAKASQKNPCFFDTLPKLNASKLTKFVEDLPTLEPQAPNFLFQTLCEQSLPLYIEVMTMINQSFHPEAPNTPMFGFNNKPWLSEVILAWEDSPVYVDWVQLLPSHHILPIMPDLIMYRDALPEIQVVMHLHGGHSQPEDDGWPLSVTSSTPGLNSNLFRYRNDQDSMVTAAHDHSMGTTRLGVQAGLIFPFVIKANYSEALLPKGKYDIPLFFKDFELFEDGKLFYPVSWSNETIDSTQFVDYLTLPGHSYSPVSRFVGSLVTTNGKAWPKIQVEKAIYRLSFLNGCNNRVMTVQFQGANAPAFTIVSRGHGLVMGEPQVSNSVTLWPLERAVVLVDFTKFLGSEIILENNNFCYTECIPYYQQEKVDLVLFQVDGSSLSTVYKVPSSLPMSKYLKAFQQKPALVRYWEFRSGDDQFWLAPAGVRKTDSLTDYLIFRPFPINQLQKDKGWTPTMAPNYAWNPPVTLGTSEIWCFQGTSDPTHPIHLHQVTAVPYCTDFSEQGSIYPPYTTCVADNIAKPRFSPLSSGVGAYDIAIGTWNTSAGTTPPLGSQFQVTCMQTGVFDLRGSYVVHCHFLEHEDFVMMETIQVE